MTYTPGRVVGSPEQDIYQGPDDPGTALPYGTPYTWHEVDALGQHVDTHYKVAGRPDLAANLDTAVTAVDANAASALRVQQDARLSSTYVARDRQVYFALDHGAKFDGATNDAPAINALISAVSAAGGGVVLLPPRTARVTQSIIAKSNVTLRGSGWQTALSLGANIAGTPGLIQIGAGVDAFTVRDLKLVGNRATLQADQNCGVWGVEGGGYNNILVENVWADGFDYMGIGLVGDVNRVAVTRNVTVRNCRTTDTGGHGILIQGGVDNATIADCTVQTHGQRRANCPGITNGRSGWDAKIVGNTVDSTGSLGSSSHAISLDTPLGRALVNNNTVTGAPAYGVEVGWAKDSTISSNIITDCAHGIVLSGSSAQSKAHCLSVSIYGNVIRRCTGNGIYAYMEAPTADMDVPPWQSRRAGWGYGTTGVLATAGGRIYKVTATTAPFTTQAGTPSTWGKSSTGQTVVDGSVTWTDLGPAHSILSIASNAISECGNSGIVLTCCLIFRVENNIVTGCEWSGIYIEGNCNMYTIGANEVRGNNTSMGANHANVRIIAPNATGRRAKISETITVLDASLANDDVFISDPAAGSARIDGRFLANSATPSVAFGNRFKTANTVATTITSFLHPNANSGENREVTVFVWDANTTFQHSASGGNTLRMAGAANYTAALGTVLRFVYNGTQWLEVGRYAGAA